MNIIAITQHTPLVERVRTAFEGAGHRVKAVSDPLEALALEIWNEAQVILVDAALMGASPGGWFFLDWHDTARVSGSTHMLPIDVLAAYLEKELRCIVELVGIQPLSNGLGEEMSLVVQRSVGSNTAGVSEIRRFNSGSQASLKL